MLTQYQGSQSSPTSPQAPVSVSLNFAQGKRNNPYLLDPNL